MAFTDFSVQTDIEPLTGKLRNMRALQEFALTKAKKLQKRMNGHAVTIIGQKSVLIRCMSSKRKSKLQEYVTKSIKKASKQLSGKRPGYVWTHFIDLKDHHIQQLWQESNLRRSTSLDGISMRVFDSEERKHLLALGYSARPNVSSRSEIRGSRKITKTGQEGRLVIHKNNNANFVLPADVGFP